MKVMDVAVAIGLRTTYGDAAGTIDERNVLDALDALAEADAENGDLFAAAAERVRHARSAGVEEVSVGSVQTRPTQLRYRAEMDDIFTDLAIDVGLRHHRKLVPAA